MSIGNAPKPVIKSKTLHFLSIWQFSNYRELQSVSRSNPRAGCVVRRGAGPLHGKVLVWPLRCGLADG